MQVRPPSAYKCSLRILQTLAISPPIDTRGTLAGAQHSYLTFNKESWHPRDFRCCVKPSDLPLTPPHCGGYKVLAFITLVGILPGPTVPFQLLSNCACSRPLASLPQSPLVASPFLALLGHVLNSSSGYRVPFHIFWHLLSLRDDSGHHSPKVSLLADAPPEKADGQSSCEWWHCRPLCPHQ